MTEKSPARDPSRLFVGGLAVAIVVLCVVAVGATIYLGLTAPPPSALSSRTAGRPAPGVGLNELPPISRAERTARVAAVRSLLDRRTDALVSRDRAEFLAGIDPDSPAFRVRQGHLFDNLRDVPLAQWSYTLDFDNDVTLASSRLARYGATVWAPRVSVSYRIEGFEALPTRQRQVLTFVRRAGNWYIGADDDFDESGAKSGRGLWDFGPVVVTRTATTIVLGHPRSADRLRLLARACDQAIPRVTAVWGTDWSRRVVVLVPDTQAELSRIIQEGTDLSQIAAVATAALAGSGDAVAGERIIVNPPNFDKLGPLGRRVVLQHEITHVASRTSTTASTSTWLAEGFADYVGYLDAGVSTKLAAQELAVEVRSGRLPTTLPTNAEFAGSNPRLAQVYEKAWLACRLIAATVGKSGLVRLYREVGSYRGTADEALQSALRRELGLSTAQFTVRWRSYLKEQLA